MNKLTNCHQAFKTVINTIDEGKSFERFLVEYKQNLPVLNAVLKANWLALKEIGGSGTNDEALATWHRFCDGFNEVKQKDLI